MNIFVLDACALIAYFAKEDGAENVKHILEQAIDNKDTNEILINEKYVQKNQHCVNRHSGIVNSIMLYIFIYRRILPGLSWFRTM